MKYLILAGMVVVIWCVATQFMGNGRPRWDTTLVIAKLKELGNRFHYGVGLLAVVLLAYYLVRSLIAVLRGYF